MKRKIKFFVGDIIQNMKLAQRVIAEIDYNSFVATEEKNYTVVRCIEIIGEAVKNIPEELRVKYPESPWKALAGMRDLAIHFYMGIDYKIVWETVNVDYPALLPNFEKIYNHLKN